MVPHPFREFGRPVDSTESVGSQCFGLLFTANPGQGVRETTADD